MKRKPSIAIFTEFYPYDSGEEFLQEELRIAEKYFDKICIISFKKEPNKITKYLPENAELIAVREGISRKRLLVIRLASIFSIDFWVQTANALKEMGISQLPESIKTIILECGKISILKANEERWSGKYDIFYSYWLSGSASYLALRKTLIGGKVISRAHGYDCFSARGLHPHRMEQFYNIDKIYPISQEGKDDLIRQGCNPDKLRVSRLGVLRTENELNPDDKGSDSITIVSCSHVNSIKRLDLMIEALSQINNTSIHWIHFGDGDLMDDIQRLAYRRLQEKNNILYSFRGEVLQQEIAAFYRTNHIDLFLNCSDSEGIPVSIMEALSYGIPCIARDVGGNHEIVFDGINGRLLSKQATPVEISDAIVSFQSQPDHVKRKMRLDAYRIFNTSYNSTTNYPVFWNEVIGT